MKYTGICRVDIVKGFERKNQLFSLCGLNCGLCPMLLGITAAAAVMVINHAELQNAVLNMERLSIAMSAGIEQYNLEQREKIKILSWLLSNYNDGCRKNFFCVAVNLLELSEIQEAIRQIHSNDELPSLPSKAQSLYVVEVFQKIADRRNIKLKLIKKK